MDIRILRYFLAVAREENITRAAESLHIAQPSLSKQLMELEQELGKQLLIRGKRKITLTEEGRRRAEGIYERHLCITQFLMQVLGLDLKTADADACRIEHVISEETFQRIRAHIQQDDRIG